MQHADRVHKCTSSSVELGARVCQSHSVTGVYATTIASLCAFLTGLVSFHTTFAAFALVGLSPFLLMLIRHQQVAAAARTGFLVGCAYGIALLSPLFTLEHWSWIEMPIISSYYPQLMWSGIVVGAILVFGGLLFAIFSVVTVVIERSTAGFIVVASLLWIVMEGLRAAVLGGITWGHLGYTQTFFEPLAAWASIGTVYLVSALALSISAFIAWLSHLYLLGRSVLRTAGTLSLYVAALVLGGALLTTLTSPSGPQPDIYGVNLPYTTQQGSDLTTYVGMLEYIDTSVRSGDGVLVLPENTLSAYVLERGTGVPFRYHEGGAVTQAYDSFLSLTRKHTSTTFLVGVHSATSIRERYNSLIVYRNGELLGRYDKHLLLPFGERAVPLLSTRPSAYRAGAYGQLLQVGQYTVRPMLCSEVYYVQPERGHVDAVVHASNETIFASELVSRYSNVHAVMRSVEDRAYLVRASKRRMSTD